MKSLLRSRKFLLLLLDTVIALVALFATNHLAPELTEEILALIAIVQPVFMMAINAIAKEDVAALAAGVHPRCR